jgi:hypothetical protein
VQQEFPQHVVWVAHAQTPPWPGSGPSAAASFGLPPLPPPEPLELEAPLELPLPDVLPLYTREARPHAGDGQGKDAHQDGCEAV